MIGKMKEVGLISGTATGTGTLANKPTQPAATVPNFAGAASVSTNVYNQLEKDISRDETKEFFKKLLDAFQQINFYNLL